MPKKFLKFRCCAKATSTGNRCRNKTLLCQRVKGLPWYDQPTNFCVVHTEAVIIVQNWWKDIIEVREITHVKKQVLEAIKKAKSVLY